MESITAKNLETLFKHLGEQLSSPAELYLLGGSALCLLGSPRETLDVDYSILGALPDAEQVLDRLSAELKLDLELVSLNEFIPLPSGAESRHRFVGHYGQVDVYIGDR